MTGAKARHLQRVGDTAAGLFRQLLNFRIWFRELRHHHGVKLLLGAVFRGKTAFHRRRSAAAV